jgi:7-cyano-7-deazaguanine synthase
MRVLLIHSGGMDSTTLLFDLLDQDHEVQCLGIDYGQRHKRELECACRICEHCGVPFQVTDLSALRCLLGGSALTSDELEIPEGYYTEPSMRTTVVPNRNMILISVAAGYAIAQGCDAVAYAPHAGDHAIYPDCRPEFVLAMREAIRLAHWDDVELLTPYLEWTKADIARRGAALDVPFENTWSCYKGGRLHCGRCGTCVERREAFQLAGVPDPTLYEELEWTFAAEALGEIPFVHDQVPG